MYQPLFKEERLDVMHELMQSQPLATLVSCVAGKLAADHLPFVLHPELSEKGVLRAHIHKGNPLWRNREDLQDAFAIFQGPQSYVTPSWYPSKQDHGKTVPTWNYAVVHVRGQMRFVEDGAWLLEHLTELTNTQESDREEPWKVTDAPEDYINRLVRGIVGVELKIESLEGTWKASQNRDERDRLGVEQGLLNENNDDATAISNFMSASS